MRTEPGPSAAAPSAVVPRRRDEVLEKDTGDGLALYTLESEPIHLLNPSAALVWDQIDGRTGVEGIAAAIAPRVGVEEDVLVPQVAEVVSELAALGLIEATSPVGPGIRPVP